MAIATCRDYGYDCDFVVEGDIDKVAIEFGKHSACLLYTSDAADE